MKLPRVPSANKTTRRTFTANGSLFLLGAGLGLSQASSAFADDSNRKLRIGLVTDLHYADKAPAGSRHYRETLTKFQEAALQFQKDKPQMVVGLGDLIDAADSIDVEKNHLKRINEEFAAVPGRKHFVLGNHCVHTLTKEEFLGGVGQQKSHYSFDAGGFHFVILDSCFNSEGQPYGRNNFKWTDANIPASQIEWLKADLMATRNKTILFVHQRLDDTKNHSVNNAAEVRKVLENSRKVIAVFQGHSHQNSHREIGGIHYCVLAAMIEGSGPQNNSYSTLDLLEDGSMRLAGFRKQSSYNWS